MLKKTTLAVLGLAINSFAFAGAMGPVCAPGNVTVPCEAKQWSFGVDAVYLKAVNSGSLAYRTTTLGGLTEVNNQWNWGFRATGAYHYNTGNDVSVSWLHYSNSESQYGLAGPFFIPLPQPFITNLAYTLLAQNRLDQVNAVAGQQINAGMIDKMRFYAGLQYAAIQENLTNYFAPGYYFNNNDYKGVGPVVGIDYSYDVSPQISLVANAAASLLYGTTRMSKGDVISPAVFLPLYASKKNVVPGFDAKLGINYAYAMPQGTINLQGGYQITEYLHALQTNNSILTTALITPVDYALYGPYVGLKYVGNA